VKRPINEGNHSSKSISDCNEVGGIPTPRNEDKAPQQCPDLREPTLKNPHGPDLGWLEKHANNKVGIGHEANCDPMQTGQIVNDTKNPNRDILYRYSKSIRGCDEAMLELFRNLVVLDEDGKAHAVPIIWGTQERAIAWILQDNTRKDGSLVVERIRLPMMTIYSNGIEFDQTRYTYHKALDYMNRLRPDFKPGFTVQEKFKRDTIFGVARGIPVNKTYTLVAWTMYMEDIDQILEQIFLKFSPVAYISVRGVHWETVVSMDSVANNIDFEPGDQNQRIIKYEFNFTARTYIPQPINRKKAILETKIDFHDGVEVENITDVLGRLEQSVKNKQELE
jgi:hypothetical protein